MSQEERRYTVWFEPSFHPSGSIVVTFGRAGNSVCIASGTHEETVSLPDRLGARFLHEMAVLEPLEIPDPPRKAVFDGIHLWCRTQEKGGRRTFQVHSPHPKTEPRQYAFIQLVYGLAWDVAREPASVHFLEGLFGYLGGDRPSIRYARQR